MCSSSASESSVLEPLGLVVELVERHAERPVQEQLPEPMVPDHLERDRGAVVGQLDPVVGGVPQEAGIGQPADHVRRAGGDHAEVLGQRAGLDRARFLQLVDRLQVILNGAADLGSLRRRRAPPSYPGQV